MRYALLLIIVALIVALIVMLFFLPDWKYAEYFNGVVIGLVIGVLASAAVSLWLSLDQFYDSMAGYRVRKTVDATKDILKTKPEEGKRSLLRDRYRYSLGVVIDRLEQTFGEKDNFEKIKEWPCLTDFCETKHQFCKDRWKLFNQSIRPVIEDINSSSFVGEYSLIRFFKKDIRQLNALTELCKCLENVVAELDAAIEANSIELNDNNRIEPQPSTDLENEYCRLHTAWRKWLRAVGVPKKSD